MKRLFIIGFVSVFVLAICGGLFELGVIVYAVTHTHQIAAAAGNLAGTADKAYRDASK